MSHVSRVFFGLLLLSVSPLAAETLCTPPEQPTPFCRRTGKVEPTLEDRSAVLSAIAERMARDAKAHPQPARLIPRQRRVELTGVELSGVVTDGGRTAARTAHLQACAAFRSSDPKQQSEARVILVLNCRHTVSNVSLRYDTVLDVRIPPGGGSVSNYSGPPLTLPGNYVVLVSLVDWTRGFTPHVLAEHCEAVTVAPLVDEPAFQQALEDARRSGESPNTANEIVNRCIERMELKPTLFEKLHDVEGLNYLCLGNRYVRQQDLKQIVRLPNLNSLRFSNAPIEDSSLAELLQIDALDYLALASCDLAPGSLARLDSHPRLKRLQLTRIILNAADLAAIRSMPRLESLELIGTNISDSDCDLISEMTQLRQLSITDADLSGAGIRKLRKLYNLESLDLSRTSISPADLNLLPSFRRLRRFGIAGTTISPSALNTALERRVLDEVILDSKQQEEAKGLFLHTQVLTSE